MTVPHGAGTIETQTYCWASCDSCAADADGDGVADNTDNCPNAANPLQENNDGDAQGDICDDDNDNDGLTDIEEKNFDGNPAYNPATDINPLSDNTDADAYIDSLDPVPLNFNFDDGDLAPRGAPDTMLNAADLLVCMQIVLGLKNPSNDGLAHGDLHPDGAPDGIIGLSDYIQLLKLVLL